MIEGRAKGNLNRRAFFGVVSAGLLLLTGCVPSEEKSFSVVYTLSFQTPQGIRTGRTVIKFKTYFENMPWPPQKKGPREVVTGEGLFVNLGDNKNIVMTLLTQHGSLRMDDLVFSIRDAVEAGKGSWDDFSAGRSGNTSFELPLADIPMLLTFDDPNKGESFRKVDPALIGAIFGEGYSLKSATVAAAFERPTRGGISSDLPFATKHMSRLPKLNAADTPVEVLGLIRR